MPIYQLLACLPFIRDRPWNAGWKPIRWRRAAVRSTQASTTKDELKTDPWRRSGHASGQEALLAWRVPDTGGYPISNRTGDRGGQDQLGVDGTIYLDYLSWSGAPNTPTEPDNN